MKYQVFIVADAEEDLFEIYQSVSTNSAVSKAAEFIENLKYQCSKLEQFPNRGHILPELERIGVYEFLEIYYKPYRIVYQIIEKAIYIHGIWDSRRDLEQLLQKRLLR